MRIRCVKTKLLFYRENGDGPSHKPYQRLPAMVPQISRLLVHGGAQSRYASHIAYEGYTLARRLRQGGTVHDCGLQPCDCGCYRDDILGRPVMDGATSGKNGMGMPAMEDGVKTGPVILHPLIVLSIDPAEMTGVATWIYEFLD